jgi:hypothetical protein
MRTLTFYRATAALITLLGTTGAIVACSSSSPTQVTPPGNDGGGTTKHDSGGSTTEDSGKKDDAGKKDDGGKKDDAGKTPSDSGSGSDVALEAMGLPDVGACKSDSSLCNSCYTNDAGADVEVPLNACSSAVGNCIQFTGTVPTGAP